MRYLDVRIRQPDWMLHPMQSFIRNEDVVQYEELLTWNVQREQGIEYELFYVEADRERYEPAIDAVDSIHWYDLTPVDDKSFYIYACQEIRDIDVEWREAFVALNLLVFPPIVYDTEAAMRMTVIGSSEDLQTMLDGLPDEIDVTVNEIGEFDARHPRLAGSMTARQREAVSVAVDLGYYDVPRTGSLEAVADVLDCAPSTASNHLRKAEAAVMRRLVEGGRRN
ncbi:helix-turn-helix domain-containing protein [Haloarchaeobius sp. HME9146]|uniref:helix-turn-helix domain-containing protein n=1 Tax=Haloarchaeobius sp. HME9146 TaxID=2978732 RepID=UPI0021BFF210|nr:helix-turn-helix domain-containing protein [Haloarchaeobius sp. HME9146]MCT9097339.1 helix-turn-helix domain-containing protein [Haloarchaeobius sp. HME9146]